MNIVDIEDLILKYISEIDLNIKTNSIENKLKEYFQKINLIAKNFKISSVKIPKSSLILWGFFEQLFYDKCNKTNNILLYNTYNIKVQEAFMNFWKNDRYFDQILVEEIEQTNHCINLDLNEYISYPYLNSIAIGFAKGLLGIDPLNITSFETEVIGQLLESEFWSKQNFNDSIHIVIFNC